VYIDPHLGKTIGIHFIINYLQIPLFYKKILKNMLDPTTALTTAINNSTKVANSPLFLTVIDKILGFKISEWGAQGEAIKKNILDGYEKAKQKGLGVQYVSAFRENTNLINIGAKSAKYIDKTKPNEIEFDNDVFWGLIEHSKQISNDDMQELISKIIAGEYNTPGMYSMSTLQTVKMLGKNELELFERMCSLIVNDYQIPKPLFSLPDEVNLFMSSIKLDFGSLQTLQCLGLFYPNVMKTTINNQDKNPKIVVTYLNQKLVFVSKNDNILKIQLPNFYGLSFVGKQLIKHVNPKINKDYFSWLKMYYKIPNYIFKEKE